MSCKIAIDAGHGYKDGSFQGAYGHGLQEDEVVQELTERLGHLWRAKHGADSTIYTRPGKAFVSNDLRAKIAKKAGAKAFISIHNNAAGSHAAQGFSCWIREGDAEDKELAKCILDEVHRCKAALPVYGKGIFPDTQSHVKKIAVLRTAADMPQVLLEVGFLSNVEDANLLKNNQHKQDLMIAVMAGIERFLGLNK
jgi:N-acetylmuramoyl-L-alanine amidase